MAYADIKALYDYLCVVSVTVVGVNLFGDLEPRNYIIILDSWLLNGLDFNPFD